MTDHTPPPEEPLGQQARDRIRADLLAAAQAGPNQPRRWLVPVAAAASVVLVAGATAWAVGSGGDDPSSGPATSTSASPTPGPSVAPTQVPGYSPTPSPAASESTVPAATETVQPISPTPTAGTQVGTGSCPTELENVLKGAVEAVEVPGDGQTTSFWVKGGRFSLCSALDGNTTVHQPLPLEPDLDDVATFRVSSVLVPLEKGFQTVRVAGGVVPEGAPAFDVAYTFPDGHTEQATKATDDQGRTWWQMVYAYDDGGGNETQKPQIEVSVTLSGSGFGFSLQWGVDTCAQANHGC